MLWLPLLYFIHSCKLVKYLCFVKLCCHEITFWFLLASLLFIFIAWSLFLMLLLLLSAPLSHLICSNLIIVTPALDLSFTPWGYIKSLVFTGNFIFIQNLWSCGLFCYQMYCSFLFFFILYWSNLSIPLTVLAAPHNHKAMDALQTLSSSEFIHISTILKYESDSCKSAKHCHIHKNIH